MPFFLGAGPRPPFLPAGAFTSIDSIVLWSHARIPQPAPAPATAAGLSEKTTNRPAASPRKCENAMKFRFTASSISSIAISTMMTLRRFRKIPVMLIAKRIAPSTR